MDRSEPTTDEIVRALLNRSVDKKSFYRRKIELIAADRLKTQERDIEWMSKKFDEVYKTWRESDSVFLEKIAADRIESQEKEIDAKTFALSVAKELQDGQERTIAALTARAEQAEAREKAVLEDMKDYCQFCWHCDKNDDEEPCKTCENVTHDGSETKWTWRGLPQDGEGK